MPPPNGSRANSVLGPARWTVADTHAVTFCCEMMRRNVEARCDQHPDPFDCPDTVVFYSAKGDRYGLIVHDGGTSYIAIKYCPWCGVSLPSDGNPALRPATSSLTGTDPEVVPGRPVTTPARDVPQSIFLELMFERPADQNELDRHIMRWLEDGIAALGAHLRAGIAARPPLQRPSRGRPVGEPFTPWGTLFISRLGEGKQRTSSGVFSEAGWQRFLADVVSQEVNLAVVMMCMLDDRGRAEMGPTIQVIYETVGTDWIRLGAMFETSSLTDPDFVRRLRQFIWSTARQCNPAFGLIDHRYRRTQLEEELASVDEENIPFMRETLRAHGWLTVVPQEIAEKLGGSSGLAATGAFRGLEELTNGGILAWATDDFTKYDPARVARIEEVLAPHLLTREVLQRHRTILAGQQLA
jgi:hypothetical protein